jgi:uncharacterized protein YndB with AHSA1/START domain
MVDRASSLSMDVHTAGSEVWVRDDQEGWLKARVSRVEVNQLLVITEKGDERVVAVSDCPLQNNDARGGVEVRLRDRLPSKELIHVASDLMYALS